MLVILAAAAAAGVDEQARQTDDAQQTPQNARTARHVFIVRYRLLLLSIAYTAEY